jgi:hypothetical protein
MSQISDYASHVGSVTDRLLRALNHVKASIETTPHVCGDNMGLLVLQERNHLSPIIEKAESSELFSHVHASFLFTLQYGIFTIKSSSSDACLSVWSALQAHMRSMPNDACQEACGEPAVQDCGHLGVKTLQKKESKSLSCNVGAR